MSLVPEWGISVVASERFRALQRENNRVTLRFFEYFEAQDSIALLRQIYGQKRRRK